MVTIEELEALSSKIADKRAEIDAISLDRKKRDAELDELEATMMMKLEEAGKHSYKSEVGTVSITSRESVRVPKDLEAKRELFAYLQKKGIFEELVSVNSQTLNSFYKAEKALAEEAGEAFFQLPGVGEPTVDQIISFRKAK